MFCVVLVQFFGTKLFKNDFNKYFLKEPENSNNYFKLFLNF